MKFETLLNEARFRSLQRQTRRQFLSRCTTGLGALFLASQARAAPEGYNLPQHDPANPLNAIASHFPGKAKRVIYLHMIGAPSQLELFDYKPDLQRLDGQPCPQSFLEGKRFAFIQGTPNMLAPQFPFQQHGDSGAWISDRLPHFSKVVDEVSFIKTLHTDQFNHGPAQLMVHSGEPRIGHPSIGSWVTWGLGTENSDLPGFVVLLSGGRIPRVGKALWGSGFLPSVYQGVQCHSDGDPVLNASNPDGISRDLRRSALDTIKTLNQQTYEEYGDPETLTRIAQYEMAFRMQMAVPDAMDIKKEPVHIHELYGTAPGKESFANNCLLARRLVERGVRFVQLFDWGWDSHGTGEKDALNGGFQDKCREADQPMAALLTDLKARGLLEDTLVVWSGEFGRTPMQENRGGREMKLVGRDHHPAAFTAWMAGGGVKPGISYGETDEVGYSPAVNPVPLEDFHATLLHLLGFEHKKLVYPLQGLNRRLTGIKKAKVIQDILA
ncbi:MAG: sulfatase [Opitutaceae bacterium]|nr:sulfatase [Opitutaceae bacterium]